MTGARYTASLWNVMSPPSRISTLPHIETILGSLREAAAPLCDDCLSDRTGISPRQAVRQLCINLAERGALTRDRYGLCIRCRKQKICMVVGTGRAVPARLPPATVAADRPAVSRPWHWEGNVQVRLAAWFVEQGWTLITQADTASKAAGKDLVLCRGSAELWVTVKGYPERTGRTVAPTQARHWFSHAMFDVVLYRGERADVALGAAFPAGFRTYHSLARRSDWFRRTAPFKFYWVSEVGAVTEE